jgi:putative tryptophan/tyrosine transport system substrate-binding protein
MRRREFITLLGGAIAWPLAVSAQQPAMPVIGFLNSRASGEDPQLLTAFREGLKEAGYVEDHNVVIDYRFAGNQNERLPALAMELVRRQVAVIVANGPAAVPAKAATTSIPVVFVIGFDPVQFGLVASLNRPGGNLTGVINLFDEIGPKRLELVHELVPAATTVGVLLNPSYPTTEIQLRDLQAAARSFGLQLHILHASSDHDFDGAFAKLGQLRAGALVIGNDPFFNSRSEQLGALSASHAVPAIFQTREFVSSGGLTSYGVNIADSYRLAGGYAGRILKGEKPADLPVQQATKVELYINLKTAKALGITVPLPLSGRADEVFE